MVSEDVVEGQRLGRRNIAVFICDPNTMRVFRSLSDSIELNFTIPESVEDLREGWVLVSDDECLELLMKYRGLDGLEVVKVGRDDVLIKVLELVGVREVGALIVGVDLGTAINYVILADNFLLKHGTVGNVSELVRSLSEVREALKPKRVFVKVGISPARLHERFLNELLSLVSRDEYILVLVDEHKTNVECPASYVGRKSFKGTDFKACINIALREGLRIIV